MDHAAAISWIDTKKPTRGNTDEGRKTQMKPGEFALERKVVAATRTIAKE